MIIIFRDSAKKIDICIPAYSQIPGSWLRALVLSDRYSASEWMLSTIVSDAQYRTVVSECAAR